MNFKDHEWVDHNLWNYTLTTWIILNKDQILSLSLRYRKNQIFPCLNQKVDLAGTVQNTDHCSFLQNKRETFRTKIETVTLLNPLLKSCKSMQDGWFCKIQQDDFWRRISKIMRIITFYVLIKEQNLERWTILIHLP